MTYYELILLAIGISLDTFAVSLSGGACHTGISRRRRKVIALTFAAFQSGMAFTGWSIGSTVNHFIQHFDHWVAFVLLAFIGGKMTWEALEKKTEKTISLTNNKILIIISIATSIDALAIGFTLSLLQLSILKITTGCFIIAGITIIASLSGLSGGKYLGKRFGKGAEFIGGIILIALGIKIVLEHVGLL